MQTWRIKRRLGLWEQRAFIIHGTRLYEFLTFLKLTYSLNGKLLEIVAADQKRSGIAGKEQLKC